MRWLRRGVRLLAIAALLWSLGVLLLAYGRSHPGDVPWAPLRLGDPVGRFTGAKLVRLRDHPAQCRGLLQNAGIHFRRAPVVRSGRCGYADGVRLQRGASLVGALDPAVTVACPVAAALAVWEWTVLQPAARHHFGSSVTVLTNYGSYACRPIRGGGALSEHATADAIDIAGFRLADGRTIGVATDWSRHGARAAFLHEVRDGACDLFATVLSPDYNAAHHDHLHLDQAARGAWGGRACR